MALATLELIGADLSSSAFFGESTVAMAFFLLLRSCCFVRGLVLLVHDAEPRFGPGFAVQPVRYFEPGKGQNFAVFHMIYVS